MEFKSQYTIAGDLYCEETIERDLNVISKFALKEIGPKNLSAIVLVGGYGRGEGGVQQLNGTLQPHNNYDILLVVNSSLHSRYYKNINIAKKLKSSLPPTLVVDADFSIMTEKELKNTRFLLFLCDAQHASKIIWGNPKVLDLLPVMELDKVPLIEGLWLLLNRSTLLLINQIELLPHIHNMSSHNVKVFLRHIAKSIIGTGDSVLLGLGMYHWSYLEKLKRLEELEHSNKGPVAKLSELYRTALEWRLAPHAAKWNQEELLRQQKTAWDLSQSVYLWFEKLRMGDPHLSWDNYLQAFAHNYPKLLQNYSQAALKNGRLGKFYNFCRMGYGAITGMKTFGWPSIKIGTPWSFLSPRDRLLIVFPHVAFSKQPPIPFLGGLLGTQPQGLQELALNYLDAWRKFCA